MNEEPAALAESSAPSAVAASCEAGSPARVSPGTLATGLLGSVAMLAGGLGAGGVLRVDPILSGTPLAAWRHGTGRLVAEVLVYAGLALLVWAWVRLGREVTGKRVGVRWTRITALAWMAPLSIAPPLFTRDVFSYLGQGELALHGLDPYGVGPAVLHDQIAANVHPLWAHTPAPYGPLFILLASGIVAAVGEHLIAAVILTRLVLAAGLALLIYALPGLAHELGGEHRMALWLFVASPMVVVDLFGGAHNDLLMIGLLACGVLLTLRRSHVAGIALVSAAMAVKATAGLALPFLVWVWAGHLEGTLLRRFARAFAAAVAVFAVVFAVVFAAASIAAGVGLGWVTALRAPTMVESWLNVPTTVARAVHALVGLVVAVPLGPFIVAVGALGGLAVLVFSVWEWWRARGGGAGAVARLALVLIAVAAIIPPTEPWYLTWGFALLACTAWPRRMLPLYVTGSVFVMLLAYPSGESAAGNVAVMLGGLAGSLLAGWALQHPDPLRLRRLCPGRA
jgi:alpha-1,6-mannosyltransferase